MLELANVNNFEYSSTVKLSAGLNAAISRPATEDVSTSLRSCFDLRSRPRHGRVLFIQGCRSAKA